MAGTVVEQDSGGLAEVGTAARPSRARRTGTAVTPESDRPRLLFFYGRTSGLSRRVEAYLAQVLQRHRNHSTFRLTRVAVEDHQELADHFGITQLPTLLVIEGSKPKA